MAKTVISVEHLSKCYRLGVIGTGYAFGDLKRWWAKQRGKPDPYLKIGSTDHGNREGEKVWALKDISFMVAEGEALGIIGRNGAGKSTLLKILSQVTAPTEGVVKVKGRIASLLEVGTGFHGELTGRENIYLNGAINGMSRFEVKRKLDEIVDFSGVEKYIDTPIKRYSSGMYVRLAFAVAAHLDPDILIVDEVLAVGDAEFQKKCLGKMGDVAHAGRTVLFVSHNMAAVQNLCTRGVLLTKGSVQMIGTQYEAISTYFSSLSGNRINLSMRKDRAGIGGVRINAIEFVDLNGRILDSTASGQNLGIRMYFTRTSDSFYPRIIANLIFKSQFDTPIFLHHNRLTQEWFGPLPEKGYFELMIKRLPLPPALYRIGFALINNDEYIDGIDDAVDLTVTDGDYFGSGEVPPISHGVCLVDGSWKMNIVPK